MTTSVGSGLGSSLGSAAETTYGAFVTPTKWIEYGSENIMWKPKRINGKGLANGLGVQRDAQRVTTTQTVVGDVKTQGFYKGLGQWLGGIMGSLTSSPVQQGGTTAYLQTHAFTANSYGQSLSLQEGIPQLGGTIVVRNWAGCKVTKAVFECKMGEVMNCTFTVDGRSEETAAGRTDTATVTNLSPTVADTSITLHDLWAPVTGTGVPANSYVGVPIIPGTSFTLSSTPTQQTTANGTGSGSSVTVGTAYGTPTYTASNGVFSFRDANFQLGAFGSEATIEGVRSLTLTLERPMKVDNFYQDATMGYKQQQVQNDFFKISVAIESDYISDPAFVGQFVTDTAQSLIWDFSSQTNAGVGHPFELKFAVPNLRWDDGPPEVTGPEIVQPKLTLVGLVDASAHTAATISYMSTDTTL